MGFSCRNAGFLNATFTGNAEFSDVTFTRDAWFDEATFTGYARFSGALAHRMSFSRAVFSAPDPGPWTASTVSLIRTALAVRSRISITATEIDASWFQAREGAHLVLHCARVDLSDSEFLRRSIVSSPAVAEQIPPRPEIKTSQEARAAATKFSDDLNKKLARIPPRCRLTSLERANIGELVLSSVVLDDCAFAGAHGLDKLRIGTDCSFQRTPRWWRWRSLTSRRMWWRWRSFTSRRMFSSRRLIDEEIRWRRTHTGPKKHRDPAGANLSAPEVAGIYRDLRKGLEDVKNEPGAADFYYGEMEMRRLAGRKPTGPASSQRAAPSWAERALLYGYWAVSGYGLRASRALITLVVVLFGAALLYTFPAFATVTPPTARIAMIDPTNGAVTYSSPPPPAAPGLWTALEFSARESISLLQARSMPAISTTGAGTVLDIALRLAGPILLGFTVLALRARTKR